MNSNRLLKRNLVCLITAGNLTPQNFQTESKKTLEIIRAAIDSKIPLIQIREKNLSALLLFQLAETAAKIAANSETKILINDRADVAVAAGADGVQLAVNSISARIIRENFSRKFIVGVSAHSLSEASKAKQQGADFAFYSPIFYTPNKGKSKGLSDLSEVCEKLKPFPIIALGGIDETNYREVLAGGAAGFAAIRFLNDLENLKKISRELL